MFCDVVLLKESKALAERRFTYTVPPHLPMEVGQLVFVPFGHQGNLPALVLNLHENPPVGFVAKAITDLISPSAFFTSLQIEMFHFIATYTLTPLAQVVLAAIPKSFLTLKPSQFAPPHTLMLRLLDLKKSKEVNIKLTSRQKTVLEGLNALRDETGEVQWTCRTLQEKFACSKSVLQKLVDAQVAEWHEVVAYRTPLSLFEVQRRKAPPLNDEQQRVFHQVEQTLKQAYHPKTHRFLLHGITGSGKTEVYMALAESVLAQGKSVLILVPEIALTGALAERFLHRFGVESLAMWHSQLSKGEKLDTWQRIASGELRLVIGARSAIFTPMKDLGFIMMDECHDGSFKQDTPAPRYDVRTIANHLSQTYQIPLLLGSATPEVGLYHHAFNQHTLQHLELHKRHGGATLPNVHIVDMKLERSQGHLHAISRPLQTALKSTIERGEQAIILLNRRGFNTFVDCHACGYVFECPSCSVSMTFHKQANRMKCHHCGHSQDRPQYCPKCGSLHIQFVGSGTQKIESELSALLGDMPILRLDGDVMQRKGAFKEVLDAFKNKESPILVGTQMVAKGLDVENVTLVGVLGADASFYMPDFMAHERGFQLLTQVAGRAGRGTKAGQVYLQSWQGEHPVLHVAVRQDFQRFYHMEIEERRANRYPPFSQLIRILISGEELERVRFFVKGLKSLITQTFEENGLTSGMSFQLLGPAPCLLERLKGRFRYHLLIKNFQGEQIHQALADTLKSLVVPEGLHCLVDVDVLQLM